MPLPLRSHCILICLALLLMLPVVFCHAAQAQIASHPDIAQPRWQFGAFAAGGFAPGYQISNTYASSYGPRTDTYTANVKLDFWNAGLLGGRRLSGLHGPGPLRGSAEALLEITPFWLARYPMQNLVFTQSQQNGTATQPGYGPVSRYGASITPLLFRWNFPQHRQSRIVPWTQLGWGVLWTSHSFPTAVLGSTSNFNFTPQLGAGVSTFLRPHQSLDLGVKAVHIYSMGMGSNDPGVTSLQFSAGYSWWR